MCEKVYIHSKNLIQDKPIGQIHNILYFSIRLQVSNKYIMDISESKVLLYSPY